MTVKQALEHYFEVKSDFYCKYKDVDLPKPINPIEITQEVEFEEIEKELGFSIHTDIKSFLSSYWFNEIEGFCNDRYVHINGINTIEDVRNDVLVGFFMGDDHFLKDAHYWYMGIYDPFSLFVNNTTGEVSAAIIYEHNTIHLFDSISDFIINIKTEITS